MTNSTLEEKERIGMRLQRLSWTIDKLTDYVISQRQEAKMDERKRILGFHLGTCSICRTINDDMEWEYCREAKAIRSLAEEGK